MADCEKWPGLVPKIFRKRIYGAARLMSHMLDKDTINRILHLHKVQGLEARVIAERFGFSSSRIHSVIRRQAASSKLQAPSATKKT